MGSSPSELEPKIGARLVIYKILNSTELVNAVKSSRLRMSHGFTDSAVFGHSRFQSPVRPSGVYQSAL